MYCDAEDCSTEMDLANLMTASGCSDRQNIAGDIGTASVQTCSVSGVSEFVSKERAANIVAMCLNSSDKCFQGTRENA